MRDHRGEAVQPRWPQNANRQRLPAQQQQQQEIQQQQMLLQLEELAAKADKARADAERARAGAMLQSRQAMKVDNDVDLSQREQLRVEDEHDLSQDERALAMVQSLQTGNPKSGDKARSTSKA